MEADERLETDSVNEAQSGKAVGSWRSPSYCNKCSAAGGSCRVMERKGDMSYKVLFCTVGGLWCSSCAHLCRTDPLKPFVSVTKGKYTCIRSHYSPSGALLCYTLYI